MRKGDGGGKKGRNDAVTLGDVPQCFRCRLELKIIREGEFRQDLNADWLPAAKPFPIQVALGTARHGGVSLGSNSFN
jgi:hypothetical protein